MNAELDSAGIITEKKEVEGNYLINAWSIFVPLIGALVGMLLFDSLAPTASTFLVFFIFFPLTVMGLITGLHRYFTHRSFETGQVFRLVLGICGSWTMQGPISRWVADHRRHHRFSDQAFDVHSPYWRNQQRISSRFMGFVHAHFLWMFVGLPTSREKYAQDIVNDPISRGCSEHYWSLCASSLLLPGLVGYVLGGQDEAIRSLIWAGCVRVSLIQQFAWSVNSIGHMYGSKADGSKDEARDNMFLTLLVFGEGLHSYHHVHQSTTMNKPSYLDLTGQFINLLEKLGVIWNVKRY